MIDLDLGLFEIFLPIEGQVAMCVGDYFDGSRGETKLPMRRGNV